MKKYQPIKITYRWQVSTDGEHWYTSARIFEAELKQDYNCGNTHKIIFLNNYYEPQDGARFWRILVHEGSIEQHDESQPWANMLFMELK